MELRRKRGAKKMHLGEGGGERGKCAPSGEPYWVLFLEGIYLEVSAEDPSRIFISFPGVSFQGQGLY